MIEKTLVQDDLSFLLELIGDRSEQYCCAFWLKSTFESDLWICEFDDGVIFEIDFAIYLDDGSLLTDPQHFNLLKIYKCWLCVQTHFDCTGGQVLAPVVARQRIHTTLSLIDYTLLNSSTFKLVDYGLEFVSENDVADIIFNIGTSKNSDVSIYRWPEKLAHFLRDHSSSISESEINILAASMPSLLENLSDSDNSILDLSESELLRARVWLFKNKYYHRSKSSSSEFKYTLNTQKISEIIYLNTLKGRCAKQQPLELCLEPFESYSREYKSVPMRHGDKSIISVKTFTPYKRALGSIGLLSTVNLPVPITALKSLDNIALLNSLNLRKTGRFTTLPQKLVFSVLRDAIEFVLEFGKDLVSCYLNVARASFASGLTCQSYVYQFGLNHLLTPKLAKIGIQSWSLQEHTNIFGSHSIMNGHPRVNKLSTFQSLRNNRSFWALIKVLYGSIQISVGTLMARREDAIATLVAHKCLDRSGTRLVFNNCKTGTLGNREKTIRPIPPLAVKMIRMLEELQDGLIDIGILKQHTFLFAYPKVMGNGLVKLSHGQYNSSLDVFCDYTETLMNGPEHRFYIRQHPLRRFFALLFFWGNSFGGMETLRWFLGHSDIEHLYRYITEMIPGEVMKGVKANYAAQQAILKVDEAEDLANLLELHFGTRNFYILDCDELEEYIEELMDGGMVIIEPEFFETPDGKRHRILINVSPIEVRK